MSNDKVQSIMALKPCPFCGNETPEFERMGTPRQSCVVRCGNCGALHESGDEGEFSGTSWNERAAIREAIAAPGVAQGWQPLETAPEDGTPIIIARIEDGCVYDVCNGHIENVLEDEEDGPWDIRGGEPWCSYVGRPRGTYFCSWLPDREWEDRWRISPSFEYTHWMPTPAAAPSPTAEQPTPPVTEADLTVAYMAGAANHRPIDKAQLKRLVCQVFGEDFQIVSIKGVANEP